MSETKGRRGRRSRIPSFGRDQGEDIQFNDGSLRVRADERPNIRCTGDQLQSWFIHIGGPPVARSGISGR